MILFFYSEDEWKYFKFSQTDYGEGICYLHERRETKSSDAGRVCAENYGSILGLHYQQDVEYYYTIRTKFCACNSSFVLAGFLSSF